MTVAGSLLEHSFVYRAWQTPFAGQKFAQVFAHNSLDPARRLLDVACDPGTDTNYFTGAGYAGMDFHARYIEDARRRHKRNFLVADVRDFATARLLVESFDLGMA